MDNDFKGFLGRGWKYPVEADKVTGKIKMSEYEEDIAEAIRIILFTRKGERVMRPEFGSNLHEFVFAVMDYTTINRIINEVKDCLTLWEPRITDVEVEVHRQDLETGGFIINISYVVRNTNNPYSLVFPYFMTEGIEI